MPPDNNNGDGTTRGAGQDGAGNPGGGTQQANPLDALETALGPTNFADNAASTRTQTTDAGAGASDGDAAGADDGGAPGDGTSTASTDEGQGEEHTQGTEATEGTEGTDAEDAAVPVGIKKRLDKLMAQNQRLQEQLLGEQEARETRTPASEVPLQDVRDVNELGRRESSTREALDITEDLLSQIAVDPGAVEQELRSRGFALKNESGQDDYTPGTMMRALTRARRNLRDTLQAVPRRRDFLKAEAETDRGLVQLRPWLADATDDRHAQLQQLVKAFPWIRTNPKWKLFAIAAMEGMSNIQKQIAARKNGTNGTHRTNGTQRTNGNRPGPSNTQGRGPAKVTVAQLKEGVMKAGTKDALVDAFERMVV